jgi:hypothetical protein
LYHDGQLEGLRHHVPVFLRRRPAERTNADLAVFHRRLMRAARAHKCGPDWQTVNVAGWDDNHSADHLLAWTSTTTTGRLLVAVNFSPFRAQGMVQLPWSDLSHAKWALTDVLYGDVEFIRDGEILAKDGLYVDLPPWQAHVLRLSSR